MHVVLNAMILVSFRMNNTEYNGIVITKSLWYLLYDFKSVRLIFHGEIKLPRFYREESTRNIVMELSKGKCLIYCKNVLHSCEISNWAKYILHFMLPSFQLKLRLI